MVTFLIKKEIKELWREGRIKWIIIILSGLLLVTIFTSYSYVKQLNAAHKTAMQADREVWDNQQDKNPHSAAHFGFYLFKPVSPMSVFEPGVDKYIGSTLYLEAHKRNTEQFSAIADETDIARFGFLSPAYILQFLIPLLIIIIGFNSISKEKENGNLTLLMSQGLSTKQLFIGKWLPIFFLLNCFLIPIFLILCVLLLILNAGVYDFLALGAMFLLYFIFYGIITNIVLLVSARVSHSGMSLIYCMVFWIASFIIVPKVGSSLANEEIIAKVNAFNKERGTSIHDRGGESYKKLVDSLLVQYKVDSVSQLPVNVAGIRLDAGEQLDTKDFEKITNAQFERLSRQQNIINAGSILSCLLPFQQLNMAFANTDIYSHHHFTNAGEEYRRKFVNMMNRHIAYDSGRQEGYTSFKAGKDLWHKVPGFTYQPPQFSVLKHYGGAMVAIALWFLLTVLFLKSLINHFKPITQ